MGQQQEQTERVRLETGILSNFIYVGHVRIFQTDVSTRVKFCQERSKIVVDLSVKMAMT